MGFHKILGPRIFVRVYTVHVHYNIHSHDGLSIVPDPTQLWYTSHVIGQRNCLLNTHDAAEKAAMHGVHALLGAERLGGGLGLKNPVSDTQRLKRVLLDGATLCAHLVEKWQLHQHNYYVC